MDSEKKLSELIKSLNKKIDRVLEKQEELEKKLPKQAVDGAASGPDLSRIISLWKHKSHIDDREDTVSPDTTRCRPVSDVCLTSYSLPQCWHISDYFIIDHCPQDVSVDYKISF